MSKLQNDIYQRFRGFKTVRRGDKKQGQSEWYYVDPRYDKDDDARRQIDVESENSPNPRLSDILANDMDENPQDYYIWRTKKDDKVRGTHAEREGKIFNRHVPPDGGNPGEDYNCRCWAEPYKPERYRDKPMIVDVSGILPEKVGTDKKLPEGSYTTEQGNMTTDVPVQFLKLPETEKSDNQEHSVPLVPIPARKPKIAEQQTTANKIVPVPARKPLPENATLEQMLQQYILEHSPNLQQNLPQLNSTNSYTTELGNMTTDVPIQFVKNGENKEQNSKQLFDEIYYSKIDTKGNVLYKGTDKHEGGFSDRKNDLGGKTNYGITQSSLDEYNSWKHPLKKGINFPKDVKQLTPEQSKQILYEMYYMRYGINQITNIRIARNVFDEEMNQGTAAGFDLASAINEYKNVKFPYNSIISASLAKSVNSLSENETTEMNDILTQKRMDRYFYSVDKHPEKNINNLRGWYNRASTYYSNPKIFENLYKSKVDYYIRKKYPQYYNGK